MQVAPYIYIYIYIYEVQIAETDNAYRILFRRLFKTNLFEYGKGTKRKYDEA